MRQKIINLVVIFIFSFLGLSLLNLEVIKGKKFKELSRQNSIRLLPQAGNRGTILDRYGNTIAGNQLSYDVMILPQGKKKSDRVLLELAEILGEEFGELKDTFKRSVGSPFAPVVLAKNIDVKKAIALEELKSDLGSIIIQPQSLRYYPYGRLASHALGYLNEIDRWRLTKLRDYGYKTKDIIGFGGVEEKYDYYLRQEEGGLSVEVDHRDRLVRILGFRPAKSGKDIQLTLDLKIQKIVEDYFVERTGSVIIMQPDTGEIIALVSQPNFSPSAFIKKSDSSLHRLFNRLDAPLINRTISGTYPAASVFKLIVASAALETGKIHPSTTFFCPGKINIGKGEFSCWDEHGKQDLTDAIAHSCNVYFFKVGLLLGGQLIHDYALRFGLGRATGIDLPYEVNGFLPSPAWQRISKFKNWYDGDTANFAIGQGELLVTALQITRMMAVFANRGYMVTPYIVKAIDNQDISLSQKRITHLPIKENTINAIREALRQTVSDPEGTANILSLPDVSIAGKTGTAQVSQGQPHGWFVGFLPFSNPKFVICVFLEHGGAGHRACVLARQIIERMIKEGLI